MNRAVLCIGSNLEPRTERVGAARDWADGLLHGMRASEIYETPEIHGIGRPYMNMVAEGDTELSLELLHELTKKFELQAGRDAEARQRGDVPVDIDIVIWNGEILRPGDVRQTFFRIGARMLGIKVSDTVMK